MQGSLPEQGAGSNVSEANNFGHLVSLHGSQKKLFQILGTHFLLFIFLSMGLNSILLPLNLDYSSISYSGPGPSLPSPPNILSHCFIFHNPTQLQIHSLHHLCLLHFSDKSLAVASRHTQDQFQTTQHASNSCAGPTWTASPALSAEPHLASSLQSELLTTP